MEKITINLNGDIHIHFGFPDDFFEDEDFDDEQCEYETTDELPEFPGLSITASGLPEDVDRRAVDLILKWAIEGLESVLKNDAKLRAGECHEGV